MSPRPRKFTDKSISLAALCAAGQVVVAWAVLGFVAVASVPAVAANATRNVLVLYSNSRLLPVNVAGDSGLRQVIESRAERPVIVFDEFLDFPRFNGPAHDHTVATFLREKYAARPPDLVVAGGQAALDFLLTHRAELFPRAPVVHFAVTRAHLASIAPLPPDVIGVPFELDFVRTIEQAFRWHPDARHLVVVTGAALQDRDWETGLRDALSNWNPSVTREFLAGLPTDDVLRRVRDLDESSIVFTPGYFEDGAGHAFVPVEAARAIATASGAPVYGTFEPFIGAGVVGGYMTSFQEMGRIAGAAVTAILDGAAPASVRLPDTVPARLQFDWRQIRRWGIDEADVPADAVARFKAPTFWEQYRATALIAATVFALQAALIGGLLLERRRRRLAEAAVRDQGFELAHAWRVATVGELTGSIAHEINQPLGAILSNAEAAELILESGANRRDDLRAILADIRRDDLRASEVVRRLRGLLARHAVEAEWLDLNDAVADVTAVLRSESSRRRVTIDLLPAASPAMMMGDRVQLQQVVINLLLNAMDAVEGLRDEQRTIQLVVDSDSGHVGITVRDRGRGISPADLPKLFDSFFTTRRDGMGLGLAISRTIVHGHGGKIWAENAQDGGAVFHVEFPAQGAAEHQRRSA